MEVGDLNKYIALIVQLMAGTLFISSLWNAIATNRLPHSRYPEFILKTNSLELEELLLINLSVSIMEK